MVAAGKAFPEEPGQGGGLHPGEGCGARRLPGAGTPTSFLRCHKARFAEAWALRERVWVMGRPYGGNDEAPISCNHPAARDQGFCHPQAFWV